MRKKCFLRVSDKEQRLMKAACDLRAGHDRDDILEGAIRALEQDSTDDSLGYGGYPNLLGAMELDVWMAIVAIASRRNEFSSSQYRWILR